MVCLVAGTVGTGLCMKRELFYRIAELEQWGRILYRMKCEMQYHMLELEELCRKVGAMEAEPYRGLLFAAVERRKEHVALKFQTIWRECVEEYSDAMHLKQQDLECIGECFDRTHASIGEQQKELEYSIEKINEITAKCKAEYENKGRLYVTVGALSGVMGTILFL